MIIIGKKEYIIIMSNRCFLFQQSHLIQAMYIAILSCHHFTQTVTFLCKKEAYQKAQEVLEKARSGISFDSLIAIYNEDVQSQYSFRKG